MATHKRGDRERIIEPIYEIRGFKGQLYLLGRYSLFWMEQRLMDFALNNSQKRIKLIFTTFNLLSAMCAIAIFIIWAKRDLKYDLLMDLFVAENRDALTVLTVMSILVTCLYGFWFVWKEKRSHIINYIALCGVSIIFNMVMMLVQFIGSAELYFGLTSQREKLKSWTKADTSIPISWHELQSMAKCCGVFGPEDWGITVPWSCCPQSETNFQRKVKGGLHVIMHYGVCQSVINAYQTGCVYVLKKKFIWPLIISATLVTEIMAFLAAYFYYFSIKVTRGYRIKHISQINN